MPGGYLFLLLGITCFIPGVSGGFTYGNASLLQAALLSNYHPPVRPNEMIYITVNFGLYSLNELDTVAQRMTIVGFMVVNWDDARLSWTPSSYGNLSETYLLNDQIWVPPLTLANPFEGVKIISDDSDTESIPINVKYNGAVIWIAPANFDVQCSVDITFYPFDSQICSMIVSTWMYDRSALGILTGQLKANTDLYEENGEWELADSEADTGSRTLYGHPVAQVTFKLYLNRKYSYYILNLVLPIVFLAFLGCVTFYNPSEAGDRSDFAMTVLLSLTVFMAAVSDRIPTTSINICILSVYLTCTLAITSSEVLACLILKQFHLNHENGQNLSYRMKKFTHFVGRIVSYRQNESSNGEDDEKGLVTVERQNTVTALESRAGGVRDQRKNQINHSDTPTVWEKDMSTKSEAELDYTYQDLARIMDIIVYYFFLILTSLVTLIFFAILIFADKRH